MRKYSAKTGIILCILLTILSTGCTSATKTGPGSPSAIVWNDIIYGYSDREVSESELGKQLGEIKRIKKPMPVENGDSNDAPVGSKIFEIKGIDINEAASIEKDGKFYRIIKKGNVK